MVYANQIPGHPWFTCNGVTRLRSAYKIQNTYHTSIIVVVFPFFLPSDITSTLNTPSIIEGRDEKSNLTIPYPRPNGRRYLGETGPSRFSFLKLLLLHLRKVETRPYLRLSTVAYRPSPTAHSVVPGLASEFEFSTYYPKY